jgi:Family of unknown function (DUF5681)
MTFKPGQTGNPGGRPKHAKPFRGMLLRELDCLTPEGITKMEALARRVVKCALDGDMTAVRIIRDSVDGLPVQQVDVTERIDDGIGRRLEELDVPQLERILKLVESEGSSGEKELDPLH